MRLGVNWAAGRSTTECELGGIRVPALASIEQVAIREVVQRRVKFLQS
jgi:hypothetical protein